MLELTILCEPETAEYCGQCAALSEVEVLRATGDTVQPFYLCRLYDELCATEHHDGELWVRRCKGCRAEVYCYRLSNIIPVTTRRNYESDYDERS